MINFRFHIASLIAIFLALALGVVMGSTVIDRAIVDGLRSRINLVEDNVDKERARNNDLQDQVDNLNLYTAQSAAYAVRNELNDQSVDIVAERGLDEEAVTAQADMLRGAGATVPGVLWLESAWNLTDGGKSANALRSALGSTTKTDKALREEGIAALSRRLTRGAAVPGESDVLDALAKAGFVTLEGVGDGDVSAATFPGTGSRALLLGGPESDIVARTTMAEMAQALVTASTLTAVGEVDPESPANRGLWLAPIRNDDELSAQVSTIDNVDLVEGRVASALAISALTRGVVGSYGFGAGADSTVPLLAPATG
jgi:Copper transport outer membrane protein, MctB